MESRVLYIYKYLKSLNDLAVVYIDASLICLDSYLWICLNIIFLPLYQLS